MIFKDFCPNQTKNRIKEHPKYKSILKDTLKLMDGIDQSIHDPIQATYPYLSLTEYLARDMDTS